MKLNLAAYLSGFILSTCVGTCVADDWPQWRGPQRDGISHEKGLLKEWPKEGPKLLWQLSDVGMGYSTPAVVGDRIYLLSNTNLDDEFVLALSVKDGKRLWSTHLGKVGNPKQQPSFPAARTTPTVSGDVLYALGSDGDLACLETASGKVRWTKNLRTDFGGKPGTWAYSESPLIDGDTLVVTPGGSDATMVGLKKQTGDVIWKSAIPGGDEAAYSSAINIDAANVRQDVQMLSKGLVGVDAKTGKFLWRYEKTVSVYRANIPTPVASGNMIYSAGAGKGGGVVALKSKDDGVQTEEVCFSAKLPTAIGGAVMNGDYLYGTTPQTLECIEFATGNIKWQERSLGAASICLADGNLYLHGENGDMALVEATADGYHEKGRFTPPDQPTRSSPMEKAWAFPVVANGRLYIRDHNLLWCYDVKK